MILIFNIHLQDCCWSICHVSWVIGFESGLRNIDFSQSYKVEKLAQYRWDIRYVMMTKYDKFNFYFSKQKQAQTFWCLDEIGQKKPLTNVRIM